jgi:hypothetical protein
VPPLQPVDKVVRVALNQLYGAARVENIFHVLWVAAAGDFLATADVNSICSTVANGYKTNLLPLLQNTLTLSGATGQDLSGPTAPAGSAAVTGAGGVFGAGEAANVACAVTWQINRHYRGGHPRTYLSGIPTSARGSNQAWSGTFTSQIAAAANAMRVAVAALIIRGGPCSLATVHRTHQGAILPVPTVDVITNALVNGRIDSQRRRLGK